MLSLADHLQLEDTALNKLHIDASGVDRQCSFLLPAAVSVQPDIICSECLFQGLYHSRSLLVEVHLVLYQSINFELVEL